MTGHRHRVSCAHHLWRISTKTRGMPVSKSSRNNYCDSSSSVWGLGKVNGCQFPRGLMKESEPSRDGARQKWEDPGSHHLRTCTHVLVPRGPVKRRYAARQPRHAYSSVPSYSCCLNGRKTLTQRPRGPINLRDFHSDHEKIHKSQSTRISLKGRELKPQPMLAEP